MGEMERRRNSVATPFLTVATVLAVFAGLVVVYFSLYIFLSGGAYETVLSKWRVYPNRWQAILFSPGARIESVFSDRPVGVGYEHDDTVEWGTGLPKN